MPRNIFLIACEPSGDIHGAHLIEELRQLNASLEFRGLGGPKMQAAGVHLLEDMTRISALGLGDVIAQYFTFRRIFYRALGEVKRWQPDLLILIDSPAFNLRFAKKIARSRPVIYYISPQIWAWGGRRIHTIKRTVSKMLTILPFEVGIYEKAGVPCEFVGHPLLDHIQISAARGELRSRLGLRDQDLAVALLAGSRESEVRRILPLMLETAKKLRAKKSEAVFFLTTSPNVATPLYDKILKDFPDLPLQKSPCSLHDLLAAVDFALITSGTATLEAAMIGTPFFLLYKASASTYFLGRQLIRVPYLGLVNLLAQKRVAPEFIQKDIHPETIAHEASVLLENRDLYEGMKADFTRVKEMLGEKGASRRAAEAVLNFLNNF